jgi:hypothetical protein
LAGRCISVPPVIGQVASQLDARQDITDKEWNELQTVTLNALRRSAEQRPGMHAEDDGTSPHARAYHILAHAAKALLPCRGDQPPYAEIAYLAAQVSTEAQLWPLTQ